MSQVESCGTHTLRCLAPQNVLESPLRKWVEGSKTGQRWKSSWEAAPRTGSADSAGSSRAKRAHLHHLLSTWPHSFPGCGPPREGHDLGRAHSVGEPISKGTDSSRLSDDCTRSSWGYSPSSRKELRAASLCVHHTGCGGTERDWGGSAPWERVVKEGLSGRFFLSFSVMLR